MCCGIGTAWYPSFDRQEPIILGLTGRVLWGVMSWNHVLRGLAPRKKSLYHLGFFHCKRQKRKKKKDPNWLNQNRQLRAYHKLNKFRVRASFTHGLIHSADYFTKTNRDTSLRLVSIFRLFLETPGTFNLKMPNPAVEFPFPVEQWKSLNGVLLVQIGLTWVVCPSLNQLWMECSKTGSLQIQEGNWKVRMKVHSQTWLRKLGKWGMSYGEVKKA